MILLSSSAGIWWAEQGAKSGDVFSIWSAWR